MPIPVQHSDATLSRISSRLLNREDVLQVPHHMLPLIVLSNGPGLISRLIHWRTKGPSHSMWMHKPGMVASQSVHFHERFLMDIIEDGATLWFWHCLAWSVDMRVVLSRYIQMKLDLPWYTTRYDWLGIVGQAINVPGINVPGLSYCSENVRDGLYLMEGEHVNCGGHPTPAALERWFMAHEDFQLYGTYVPAS